MANDFNTTTSQKIELDKIRLSGKLTQADIVNNLTSTDTLKALSAAQGKALSDKLVQFANTNMIYNGDFSICQGPTSGISIAQSWYLLDGWVYLRNTGAMHFWQEDIDAAGRAAGIVGRKLLHLQPNGGADFLICQFLENDLPPGKYTLSFYAATDGGTFIYGPLDDSRVVTPVNSQWHKYSATFDNPLHRNRISIMRSLSYMPECTVRLADAKLEQGAIATPFVRPDTATELIKCQRFYEVITNSGGNGLPPITILGVQNSAGTKTAVCLFNWRVKKHRLPTILINNVAAGNVISLRDSNTGVYATGTLIIDNAWDNQSLDGLFRIRLNNPSADFVVGGMYEATITADARL